MIFEWIHGWIHDRNNKPFLILKKLILLTLGSVSKMSIVTAINIRAQSHTDKAVAKLLDFG